MQTDAISSQPTTAITPVTKLTLPTLPNRGEENFDYYIELIGRNETSEELADTDSKEPEVDPTAEEMEPAGVAEIPLKLAKGLPAGQSVERDVAVVVHNNLAAEAQALTVPANHPSEVGDSKVLSSSHATDITQEMAIPDRAQSKNRGGQLIEAGKVDQSRPFGEVATNTGILPMFERDFSKQSGRQSEGVVVGNFRQISREIISERPISDYIPGAYDEGNRDASVKPPNGNPQQLVSELRATPVSNTVDVANTVITEVSSSSPKISPQFPAFDAAQSEFLNAEPVRLTAKDAQLPTATELVSSNSGPLQKPNSLVEPSQGSVVARTSTQNNAPQMLLGGDNFADAISKAQVFPGLRPTQTLATETATVVLAPSPDAAAEKLTVTGTIVSPKPSERPLAEPKSSLPISDPRWRNSTTSLPAKPTSSPAGASETVGVLASRMNVQPLEVDSQSFFRDGDWLGEIPMLSKEGLTPNGPVRSTETVFTHPGTAKAIVSQMLDALSNAQNKRIEIALNPEELGRVRMVLSTTDAGISVSIMAERPETLDLMRRHIHQLTEEFRSLGYVDIGFDFSGDGTNSRFDDESERRQGFTEMEPNSGAANTQLSPETKHSKRPPVLRGLDMRL